MKVFIIMFNRLTWPRRLAEQLSYKGCEVILVDNNSTYPPLLEWYENCPYKIHRLEKNVRAFGFWQTGILEQYTDRYYMVTDCDLDINTVPDDFTDVLLNKLKKSSAYKVGLSLEINDLPDNDFTKKVIAWEKMFWNSKDKDGFYHASVATTLAVYDKERTNPDLYNGMRSPRPYTAKHLCWYMTPENITDEDLFSIRNSHIGWDNKFAQIFGIK